MEYSGWLITSPEEFLQLARHYERAAFFSVSNADWYQSKFNHNQYASVHLDRAKDAWQKGAVAYAIARRLAQRGVRHEKGYAVLRKEMS